MDERVQLDKQITPKVQNDLLHKVQSSLKMLLTPEEKEGINATLKDYEQCQNILNAISVKVE